MESQGPRVLVVDPDPASLGLALAALGAAGLAAEGARSGEEALRALGAGPWHAVVTELAGEGMSGLDLLRELRRLDPLRPVLCVSGERSFEAAVEMVRLGATDFLAKPLRAEDLVSSVRQAILSSQGTMDRERLAARAESLGRDLLALRLLGEASSRDILQTLFRKAVEAVGRSLGVETVSLMLLEGETLLVTEGMGIPAEVIGKARVPVGSGISGYVAQTGKPLLVNDISRDERFRPSRFQTQYRTQSALCVPLVRGERVLGVLNANNKVDGQPFTESDLGLLVTVASQVALSLENARLFRGLEEKAEALARAHGELVRLDKDKTELILNISHELKTPLTAIIGFASLIEGLELQGEVSSLRDYVTRLETSAQHLNHLIERILELFRLEAGHASWQVKDLAPSEVVGRALAALGQAEGRGFPQDLAGAEGVVVPCDPNHLPRAVELVLENAVKFSPPGSPVRIAAQWQGQRPSVPDYAGSLGGAPADGGGWIVFRVDDSGVGMRPKDIPCIFDKFRQLGDIMTSKPKGIGLGLSIARAIMERHSGAVWAESATGKGSSLFLALPARKA